jgi:single-strand DNA-binding protein
MLMLNGHGRLTRDPQLRQTASGKAVSTVSVATDRRDRDADPVYVDLIVWEAQARAAAQHLVKGQSVAFSRRFEPRSYTTSDNQQRESSSRSSAWSSSTDPSPPLAPPTTTSF